jgi:hypothetical protein
MADTPNPINQADAAEIERPRLYARGVFYRGADPDTTEFSGALFDENNNVLARQVHGVFPFALAPKARGRPPKDIRDSLALVAAFDVHMCEQQGAGYKPKKTLAYASLKYADDRAARAALAAARAKVDRLLPDATWEMVYQPEDPTDYLQRVDLPELGGRGLWGVWFAGDGARLELGKPWRGCALGVFVPLEFDPHKDRPAVRWIDAINM